LAKARQVVLFDRNENIISITCNKDKSTMTVRGKCIKKQDANRLAKMGLDVVRGFIQMKTDGQVLEHNADKVTDKGAIKIYCREIRSVFDRAPKKVVLLRKIRSNLLVDHSRFND
jgi:predicted TIM-barrel enzyme